MGSWLKFPSLRLMGFCIIFFLNRTFLTFFADDIFDRNIDQLDVRETPR